MRTIFVLLCVVACGGQTDLSGPEAIEDGRNIVVPDRVWDLDDGDSCEGEVKRSWQEDGCSCAWKRDCKSDGCKIDMQCKCWRPSTEPSCECDGEGCGD